MPRKEQHPDFIEYMHFIASHPNYEGMPDLYKDDGEIQWETPSNRLSGKYKDSHQKRLEWWRRKAISIGIDPSSGQWISRTSKLIHPTKEKPCSVCGKIMDLRYSYPSSVLVNRLKRLPYIDENFLINPNEHILHLINRLEELYGRRIFDDIPDLLETSHISVPSIPPNLSEWAHWIDESYIPDEPSTLSPGAMSNAPDRLDGFHTYNRCCRTSEDTGRSQENLRTYSTDRRVFEFWNQGDWIAADRLVGQIRSTLGNEPCRNGHPGPCSADHIGPLSLGFNHRPEFQLLCSACNSAKNNRMLFSDVVLLREAEREGKDVISWHSRALWNAKKMDVIDEETALRLSKLLRDNRHNFLNVLRRIAEAGSYTFLATYLELQYADFDISFEDIRVEDHITIYDREIRTRRETLYASEQKARRCRIAFTFLREYFQIVGRNVYIISTPETENRITRAIRVLAHSPETIKEMDARISTVLSEENVGGMDIGFREIVGLIPTRRQEPEGFTLARSLIEDAMGLIADVLSGLWNDERYVRADQRFLDL